MKLYELDEMIKAVCPIHGINCDGKIWFTEEATEAQKSAAIQIMNDNIALVEYDV